MTSSSLIPCYVSKKQHLREQSALFFGIVSREEFLASLSCVLWLIFSLTKISSVSQVQELSTPGTNLISRMFNSSM